MDQKEKTIAIIGASNQREKYGNIAVRTYKDAGWTVYPVNPKSENIEGLPAYKQIEDVPAPINRISVYLPPKRVLPLLDSIAQANPTELWLNPGTESPEVIQKAKELGLNVIQACSLLNNNRPL